MVELIYCHRSQHETKERAKISIRVWEIIKNTILDGEIALITMNDKEMANIL